MSAVNVIERRIARFEASGTRPGLALLGDGELDARLRDELAAWLRDAPDGCPAKVRAEVPPS